MSGLNYLLQTNLYLILFMAFYALVLRKETFFNQNRIYLNASLILSFLIPFLNTAWFSELFITEKIRDAAVPMQMMYEVVLVETAAEDAPTIAQILSWIYLAVVGILSLRLIMQLLSLSRHFKTGKGAFSFFNRLFIEDSLQDNPSIREHELVHIRQGHSADIILTELIAIISWFNPVVYLYKREIRHIHEFIADEKASGRMNSKGDYAKLLLSTTFGVQAHELSNNFFNHSLLKRRIMMLYKTKSKRRAMLKYGFCAPLFAGMLIFSAASASNTGSPIAEKANQLIRPVNQILESTPESVIKGTVAEVNLIAKVSKEPVEQAPVPSNLADKNERGKAASNPDDLKALKMHIMRTARYPLNARQQSLTGLVLMKLTVNNKKLTSNSVESSQSPAFAEEAQRVLSSFKDELDIPNGSYLVDFVFQLQGRDAVVIDQQSRNSLSNYKGSIVIVGYPQATSNSTSRDAGEFEGKIMDFSKVEVLPEFEGGIQGWASYLQNNLIYPETAKKEKIQGRVIVSFVVGKDGDLTDIKVLRGIGGGADEEAVRILENSPKWKPGMINGEPVRVAYTMPIFFQLASPEVKKDNN